MSAGWRPSSAASRHLLPARGEKDLTRSAYSLLRCGGAALFAVVVVVVALLERVAVLLQVEVVQDRAEHGDVALAEPLGGALHEVARGLAAVDAEHHAVRARGEDDRVGHGQDR